MNNLKKLKKASVSVDSVWGSTLHHIDDLPYNPKEYLPHIYGKFREKNAGIKVRPLLEAPKKGELPFVAKPGKEITDACSYLPSLKELGYGDKFKKDSRQCYDFIGGEDHGLKRIQEYIHEKKSVGKYADTRNNLIGSEYSSKLSPWLANGCISVRDIYFETREFEKANGSSESTKVFIDELFWRDFNRYWFIRYGTKNFFAYGVYDRTYYKWQVNHDVISRWREGRTGMPLIDALMREMNTTGFMPNRGRMIVACYLT